MYKFPEMPQTTLIKVGLGILALVVAVGLFSFWLSGEKREAVEEHKIKVEAKASDARDVASDERLEDALEDAQYEGDLHNAIDQAPIKPAAKLSDAELALNCERLRKRGRIPPACRSQDTGGTEPGTD